MSNAKPLAFIILDGWGYNPKTEYNAIANANTPQWDKLIANYPNRLISGSGVDVGLPDGQMGNSEVGHMHLGAGRIIAQDFTRISDAVEDQTFFSNPTFLQAFKVAQAKNSRVHIMGLLSPGGVHSHEQHLFALLKLAEQQQCPEVLVHAFLDGRDCPPRSAQPSLEKLQQCCQQHQHQRIASISGRYYAMDRDQRWARTQQVYDTLTTGKAAFTADSALEALTQAYNRDENDEFVQPTLIGEPVAIADDDVVIFFNFRADRARQLTRAFIESTQQFTGFTRQSHPQIAEFISMTEYAADLPTHVAFPPQPLNNVLGEVIANHQLKQFRIAETEKYAHVTFFFNGGREQPFPGEERALIASPRDVDTYDQKPEMSAFEVTDKLVAAIESQQFDFFLCNFANPDMVGHTGNIDATIKAVEVIDTCIGRIIAALDKVGGECLITSDHGNAEMMFDPETQQAHTAHTNLPVPLVYYGRAAKFDEAPANLADLAPTILQLMGINIPREMTGRVLLTVK